MSLKKTIEIAGRPIGEGHPPFLIAEMSANHGGDLNRAISILEQAKASGADAVKLQTYRADHLTLNHDSPDFVISEGPWAGQRLFDLYKSAETPWEWHPTLFAHASRLELILFSSPFDDEGVELLESLGAPAYKIASFEVVDLPLIARTAQTGRPLIISTGMATLAETREAVEIASSHGASEVALMHTISAYPAPPEEANLKTIPYLAHEFGVPVGLSDHSLGTFVSVAACAMGAKLIEKHLIMSRDDPSPDAAFSMEPAEFRELCEGSRGAARAIGDVVVGVTPTERTNTVFRRSLYTVNEIKAGSRFTRTNVRSIRPSHGLPPKMLPIVLQSRATRDLASGTPLALDMIEPAFNDS